MRIYFLLAVTLFIAVMVGCKAIPTATPAATPTIPSKQPEPQRPLIKGQITGLSSDTLVRVYIRTPSLREKNYFSRPGDGLWEAVVTEASGVDYVVTAEAEGFTSNPVSYTIHLSGTTAYVVKDSQITTDEALHLDFHFTPANSP